MLWISLSLSLSLSSSFKKSHKIEIFNAPPLFQFYFSPVNELFDKDGLMTFFNMLFKPFFFSLGIRNDWLALGTGDIMNTSTSSRSNDGRLIDIGRRRVGLSSSYPTSCFSSSARWTSNHSRICSFKPRSEITCELFNGFPVKGHIRLPRLNQLTITSFSKLCPYAVTIGSFINCFVKAHWNFSGIACPFIFVGGFVCFVLFCFGIWMVVCKSKSMRGLTLKRLAFVFSCALLKDYEKEGVCSAASSSVFVSWKSFSLSILPVNVLAWEHIVYSYSVQLDGILTACIPVRWSCYRILSLWGGE